MRVLSRSIVVGLVLAVAGLLLMSSSTAGHRRARLLPPAPPVDPRAVEMDSTPGAFVVPQVGTLGFRCDDAWAVQPEFDTRGSPTEERVTMQAGRIREVSHPRLGSTVALPFGYYRTVVVTVTQGTEARAITARLTATFIDGSVHRPGAAPGHACYVTRWRVDMSVNPY